MFYLQSALLLLYILYCTAYDEYIPTGEHVHMYVNGGSDTTSVRVGHEDVQMCRCAQADGFRRFLAGFWRIYGRFLSPSFFWFLLAHTYIPTMLHRWLAAAAAGDSRWQVVAVGYVASRDFASSI